MGMILSREECSEGIKFTLELGVAEAESLKGNFLGIHMFCSDVGTVKTGVIESGLKKSIKHFVVPKELRMSRPGRQPCTESKNTDAFCQRIDLADKTCFIYILPKQCQDCDDNSSNNA